MFLPNHFNGVEGVEAGGIQMEAHEGRWVPLVRDAATSPAGQGAVAAWGVEGGSRAQSQSMVHGEQNVHEVLHVVLRLHVVEGRAAGAAAGGAAVARVVAAVVVRNAVVVPMAVLL